MKKQVKDLFWNYASIIIMAVAGLLMNATIALFYNSVAVGIFNESYAWYMILSQISTWGIHMAVLHYVPAREDGAQRVSILKSAFVAVFLFSFITTISAETVLLSLDRIEWKESLQLALFGIPFFSMNKVLLHYLNAICELKAFAFFQAVRYVLLAIGIMFFSFASFDVRWLATVFPLVEIMVLLNAVLYLRTGKLKLGDYEFGTMKELVAFGTRILPSNMVVQMNLKVDVICLGFLVQDISQIGVYSFAALFAEGFYMIFFTIRRIVNPGISASLANNTLDAYVRQVDEKIHKYLLKGAVTALVAVIAAYSFWYCFMGAREYRIGLLYIAVICIAIAVNGRNIIWGDFLNQIGFPEKESKVNLFSVAGNIVLNLCLIPQAGVMGAALATGGSHFIYGTVQRKYIRDAIGITI